MIKVSESQHGQALLKWATFHETHIPELRYLFHIPNGGARTAVGGAILKSEGVKKGVPDYFLPVPSQGYHGLFIELKTATGKLSPEQKTWLENLTKLGYSACVARGWEEATEAIKLYLNA